MSGHGGLTGETWEQSHARWTRQQAAGEALAAARWERGQRLTAGERAALGHNDRWGTDGYPVSRLGRGWTINHPSASWFGILRTKAEAVGRWETLIDCWVTLSGLEAQERASA